MHKFDTGDMVAIDSRTSSNDRRLAVVHAYANGRNDNIVRVLIATPYMDDMKPRLDINEKPIQIRESSLRDATIYDVLRNMPDASMDACMQMFYTDSVKALRKLFK